MNKEYEQPLSFKRKEHTHSKWLLMEFT